MTPAKLNKIEEHVRKILEILGEDITREGLKETPSRVAKKYSEIFDGYNTKPEDVLNKKFFEKPNFSDYVWLKKIEFYSTCEHHMLPISGFVDICYIPKDSIVGLSKLARLVDVFAKRLQLQERFCMQIAESIQENLDPFGVGVRVCAKHYCMSMRGSKKQNSYMETTYFTGVFRNNDTDKTVEKKMQNIYRSEFFTSLALNNF